MATTLQPVKCSCRKRCGRPRSAETCGASASCSEASPRTSSYYHVHNVWFADLLKGFYQRCRKFCFKNCERQTHCLCPLGRREAIRRTLRPLTMVGTWYAGFAPQFKQGILERLLDTSPGNADVVVMSTITMTSAQDGTSLHCFFARGMFHAFQFNYFLGWTCARGSSLLHSLRKIKIEKL